jgi:hypothetical protein
MVFSASRPPVGGPYWGSPRASNRRALGHHRPWQPVQGSRHGAVRATAGARPRTECGGTLSGPYDDPFRPRRPMGPQMLMNLGQRDKPHPPSLASKMSTSYISMTKIYRSAPKPVMSDASAIYFNTFRSNSTSRTKRECTFGMKSASAMRSSLTPAAPTRSPPFQPRRPR